MKGLIVMKLNKIIAAILGIMMTVSANAFAAEDISVIINGVKTDFDVPPQIIEDRTLVPMRKIFETLGAKVTWIGELNTIIAAKGENVIAMTVGIKTYSATNVMTGETKNIDLDVPPTIIEDRTLVPIRAVSEALDKNVEWNGETKTVIINDK